MGHTLPVFTKFDNPAATAPAPVKQLTFSYLVSNDMSLFSPLAQKYWNQIYFLKGFISLGS